MAEERLDRIHIRELGARCIIGIYPHERENKQEVLISICLYADLRLAGQSDRIEDTVDYKRIKRSVLDMVEASSFNLVERLAQRVAEICLETPNVRRVDVSVDKPGALRFAKSVAVEITRERERGG